MTTRYPNILLESIEQAKQLGIELPERIDINTILDVAFYSSLQREEGRHLAFSLTFISPESIERENKHTFSALTFDKAEEFSINRVVKLAPAIDHRIASIGVWHNAEGLYIWGFFRHGSSQYEVAEGLSGAADILSFKYLTVTCEQPGRLDVDVGFHRIGSFAGGDLESGVKLLVSDGPVLKRLAEAATRYREIGYAGIIQRVVWAIRSAQHGGTLLFLPDSDMQCLEPRFNISTNSRASFELHEQLYLFGENWVKLSELSQTTNHAYDVGKQIALGIHTQVIHATSKLTELQAAIKDSVQFAASLANVDGALVISDNLRIMSFGAMIVRSSSTNFKVSISNVASGDVVTQVDVDKIGGARHQSAAHFCHQRPLAIAFVVSQDGKVSCFYNDGSKLLGWLGIRLDRRNPLPR